MKKVFMRKQFVFLLAMISIKASLLAQVVPNNLTSTPGNSVTSIPFTWDTPVRYQEVFSASQFGLISNGGDYITGIVFRGDETFGLGDASIANIQISLSTIARGPDGLSTTFAQNIGLDDRTVFGPAGLLV